MTDLLNLDELAEVSKQVKLHGEVYEMKEASVREYIAFQRDAKKLEANGDDGLEEFEMSIRMISLMFPDIPEDVLSSLTFSQLSKIIQLIQKGDDEIVKEVEAAEATEDSEKKSPV